MGGGSGCTLFVPFGLWGLLHEAVGGVDESVEWRVGQQRGLPTCALSKRAISVGCLPSAYHGKMCFSQGPSIGSSTRIFILGCVGCGAVILPKGILP